MRSIAAGTVCVLAVIILSGCGTAERQDAAAARGTAEMAEMLQQIYRQALADPVPYFNLNHRRVELWRRELAQTSAWPPEVRSAFVYELLVARPSKRP